MMRDVSPKFRPHETERKKKGRKASAGGFDGDPPGPTLSELEAPDVTAFGEDVLDERIAALEQEAGRRPQKAKPAKDKDARKPHYHGHRERLRARFQDAGPDALADYELLELLLFRAIPRRDTKPIAKALLDRFGSFGAVLAAEPARLAEVAGVGASVALEIKAVHAAATRMRKGAVIGRQIISSQSAILEYLSTELAHEKREQFRTLLLNKRHELIADEMIQRGTVDQAQIYVREVIDRALAHGATGMVLVHNHPSGDPTPSRADIAITKDLIAAAQPLGIAIHDHIIVGRDMTASFKTLGLI